jgi:iron complex transport system ATP-binding protein
MRNRLEIEGLAVGYHGTVVLGNLRFSAAPGELIALMGANGCGKSTLLKTLAALLPPLFGNMRLNGQELRSVKPADRARRLAFQSQNSAAAWPFTVRELVEQGRFPHRGWFGAEGKKDREAVDAAIETTALGAFESRLVTELSGGELQRVHIARAIAQEPEIYLLDEPVSQLDAKYEIEAMTLIKKLTRAGATALVSLHDLNLAAMYADRIALFAGGALVALGPPREVLREELLYRTFGSTMVVGTHPGREGLPAIFHPLPAAGFS